MGFYRGPKIVTDGLVLYLDAANTRSYPGTGTNVVNMTGGKNGTLNGGTIASGGTFQFDGVNDTIRLGTGNDFFPLPQYTFSAWVKTSQLGAGMTRGGLLSMTYGSIFEVQFNGTTRFTVWNGTAAVSVTGSTNVRDGKWRYLCASTNGTTSTIYIDGSIEVSGPATWIGTTNWPTNDVNLGTNNNDAFYYLLGEMSLPSIYNRALTPQEILQNYNATKSRYNL